MFKSKSLSRISNSSNKSYERNSNNPINYIIDIDQTNSSYKNDSITATNAKRISLLEASSPIKLLTNSKSTRNLNSSNYELNSSRYPHKNPKSSSLLF